MSHEPLKNPLLEAASDYMQRGLRVIALTGKAPNTAVHKNGIKDAFSWKDGVTFDEAHAAFKAFNHPETTGIGIATGYPYFVVDIDGPEGAEAWLEIAGEEFMPTGWASKTGRGLHLWFADYVERPSAKLAEKLDFKGEGGYVAAPPSKHPDGHIYEWLLEPCGDPPVEIPDGLRKVLSRRATEAARKMATKQTHRLMRRHAIDNGRIYAVATFDGIISRVRDEGEGNRNAVVYWAARTMLEEGADEEDLEELLDAAQAAGLTRREARRTIRSAADARG